MDVKFKRFLEHYRLLLAFVRIKLVFIKKYRRAIWPLAHSRATGAYLRSHRVRKLQIGAGPNILEGWLNTDECPTSRGVIYLDATKPFWLEDGTFDYIFSEHQIEHLTYREGLFMLHECYRILKAGGRIRIATPDLETLIGLHTPDKSDLQQRYIKWIIDRCLPEVGIYRESFVINNAFRHFGHQFIYDRATLQSAMEEVGFIDITRHVPGESEDEVLRGIESHGKAAGDEDINRFETMVLEAKRPM
ncbi:hypothetical protein ES703_14403 [subsurface metagenome]